MATPPTRLDVGAIKWNTDPEERRKASAEGRASDSAQRDRAEFILKHGIAPEDVKVPAPVGDTAKSGEEYLATLPPSLARQVKMLSEGRMAMPTGAALRSPRAMELIAAAAQYDPTLDAANAATRMATRKDFTSGKTRQTINSLNTVIGHLGTLREKIDALNNTPYAWWNAIANPTMEAVGDEKTQRAIAEFKAARNDTVKELIRAFKGQGATLSEIQKTEHELTQNASPTTLYAAVDTYVELLASRLDALAEGYKAGMGRSVDPVEFLTPKSRKLYEHFVNSPLNPEGYSTEIAKPEQEAVVGKQEREITAQLQEAFDKGASAQDLQKMATELYGGKGQIDPAKLDEAIKFREDFIRRGGIGASGASIAPMERAPTTEEAAQLRELNDPTRTATANLGSALTANIAPELMGDSTRANLQYMSGQSPKAAFLGQMAGAIPTSLGGAYGLTKLGVNPVTASILADTLYGGTSGAAQAGEGNRMFGAVTGGATGAGGSLAGRYVLAPAVTKLGQLTKYLPSLSFSDEALLSKSGDIAAAEAKLREAQRLGLPYGMADTSQTAGELTAQAARRAPALSEDLSAKYLTREAGAADRATTALEENVAPPLSDVKGRQKAIRDAAEIASAPHYDTAMARMAPNDPALDKMLSTDIGKKALKAAYDKAEAEGVDTHGLGLDLNAQGEVVLVQKPSWETLHWARKGLRDLVEENRNDLGVLDLENNPAARNANKFLLRLTARMENLNPDYKIAQSTYAKYMQPSNYLDYGLKAAENSVKEGEVDAILKRIDAMPENTPEEIALKQQAHDAFREGYSTRLADDISKSKTSDPYRVVFGSPRQQAKMGMLGISPDDFGATAALERNMAETGKRVRTGATGAMREEAKNTITAGDFAQGAMETAISGAPYATATSLGRKYLGSKLAQGVLDRLGLGMTEARATELLPKVAGFNPEEALANIQAARQAQAEYLASLQAPRAASTMVGGLAANATQDDNREYPYGINPAARRVSISAELPGQDEENFGYAHGGLAVNRKR